MKVIALIRLLQMEQTAWVLKHEDVLRLLEQEIGTWAETKFRIQLIERARRVWSD